MKLVDRINKWFVCEGTERKTRILAREVTRKIKRIKTKEQVRGRREHKAIKINNDKKWWKNEAVRY